MSLPFSLIQGTMHSEQTERSWLSSSFARHLGWVVVGLLVAAAFRLISPLDFEYKYDQHYLFERSQRVGVSESWPVLGMPSGVGTRNPPLSVWIFIALAKMSGADSPEALTLAQIFLNLIAFAGLGAVILRWIPESRREPWLWALGLAAVNWHHVFYDRVLWSASVLSPFCVMTLVCFLARGASWASAGLGFFSLLLGQFHMPGFYFFLMLSAALGVLDRRSVRWRHWALGVALATLPMLHWIGYLLTEARQRGGVHLEALLKSEFGMHWFQEATGTGLLIKFGDQTSELLQAPILDGAPTNLVRGLQAVCTLIGFFAVALAARKLRRGLRESGWRSALFPHDRRDEAILFWGGGVGFGILISLSGFRIYPHYLLTAFPVVLLSMTLALYDRQSLRRSRFLLTLLLLAQALTTGVLRQSIHETGGSPNSDHGVIYSRQRR